MTLRKKMALPPFPTHCDQNVTIHPGGADFGPFVPDFCRACAIHRSNSNQMPLKSAFLEAFSKASPGGARHAYLVKIQGIVTHCIEHGIRFFEFGRTRVMVRGILALTAGTLLAAVSTQALAGGFSRGSANLDGLYITEPFAIYSGVTFVAPGRSYSEVNGANIVGGVFNSYTQEDVEFAESYYVPYISLGGRLLENFNCVASYSQPFGADSAYEGDITFSIAKQSLATDEYGATCAYKFDVGPGQLSLIGGGFYEEVEYNQARNFNAAFGTSGDSTINVTSDAWGYRAGVAYEVPEIALRAQLLYRSQTDHEASGVYSNTPFAILAAAANNLADAAAYGAQTSAGATTEASLPQSVELSLQSGIAPGWLAFGSVKWTDWSVLEDITLTEGILGRPFSTTQFFFKDGWTVTGGLAHRINEQIALTGSLTWDKGVTSGWDTLTDTWTFAAGAAVDVNESVQLRLGGALIYLTEGERTKTSSAVDYTAKSDAEWGYALSGGFSVKF